ncbi:hypothetical protein [Saccharothrix australiensis]|uniref:Uncharacterized protein n=1 Tax=Saccharothrix australiensis TaxID=2072 RepID=A0A495W5A1_9PSEU|nr:hypothetical protein [Saccharothrix australiensis]RKT56871.1 hypothetical protein C8E97_5584 [Saccharothrix australiensis]
MEEGERAEGDDRRDQGRRPERSRCSGRVVAILALLVQVVALAGGIVDLVVR